MNEIDEERYSLKKEFQFISFRARKKNQEKKVIIANIINVIDNSNDRLCSDFLHVYSHAKKIDNTNIPHISKRSQLYSIK